jgi:diguanylate cyclase (GGDEF)-like protein/PAS domain S-box-containing protein
VTGADPTAHAETPAGHPSTTEPPERLFRAIVESQPYVYAVLDDQTRFVYVNEAAREVLGLDPDQLRGRSAAELIHPDDLGTALDALSQVVEEWSERPGEGIPLELRVLRADGTVATIEVGTVPRFDDPDVRGVILRARPVSGQQYIDRALQALVASSPLDDVLRFLAASLEHDMPPTRVAILYDWDGERFTSAASTSLPEPLTGPAPTPPGAPASAGRPSEAPWQVAVDRNELVVWPTLEGLPPEVRAAAAALGLEACWAMPVALSGGPPVACVVAWRELPGSPWVSHEVSLERARSLVALAFERRRAEDRLRHAAQHDTLTGVPNRSQFFERLDRLASADTGRLVAILYLDLDGFKPVNDTYGHAAGDQLLQIVSGRLGSHLRGDDLLARLGGDEFAVICPGVQDPDEAVHIAERLLAAVREPAVLDGGVQVSVGVSIGIALGEGHEVGEGLLETADDALYHAKRDGKGRWHLARS